MPRRRYDDPDPPITAPRYPDLSPGSDMGGELNTPPYIEGPDEGQQASSLVGPFQRMVASHAMGGGGGPFSQMAGVPTPEQEALQQPAFDPVSLLAIFGGGLPGEVGVLPGLARATMQEAQGALLSTGLDKLTGSGPPTEELDKPSQGRPTESLPGEGEEMTGSFGPPWPLAGPATRELNIAQSTKNLPEPSGVNPPGFNTTGVLLPSEQRELLQRISRSPEPVSPYSYPHGAGSLAHTNPLSEGQLGPSNEGPMTFPFKVGEPQGPYIPSRTNELRLGWGASDTGLLAPFDKLYHGINVWGGDSEDKLNKIRETGLKGGWFSNQPHAEFGDEGDRFLAIDPKYLPKILTQRRVHLADPELELVPDWKGGSGEKDLSLEHLGEGPRRRLLEKMGALGQGEINDANAISVHPYHIWLADQAGKLMERLGLKRAGEKATELLPDIAKLLKSGGE